MLETVYTGFFRNDKPQRKKPDQKLPGRNNLIKERLAAVGLQKEDIFYIDKSHSYALLKNDWVKDGVVKMYRLVSLIDFNGIRCGEKGGYIHKETVLNFGNEETKGKLGSGWVYDNAKVGPYVKVNGRVTGDAIVTVPNTRLVKMHSGILVINGEIEKSAIVRSFGKIDEATLISDKTKITGYIDLKQSRVHGSTMTGIFVLNNVTMNNAWFTGIAKYNNQTFNAMGAEVDKYFKELEEMNGDEYDYCITLFDF